MRGTAIMSAPATPFYVTGGTLRPRALSYVGCQADHRTAAGPHGGAGRGVGSRGAPGRLLSPFEETAAVRALLFPTDDFLAAFGNCNNRRTQDPEFERLAFCLLGVATPSDLIQDTRTTPFNLGKRIELTDFTAAEAAPLAHGWGGDAATGAQRLERVLHWTGGHPYLTQRLCQAVSVREGTSVD